MKSIIVARVAAIMCVLVCAQGLADEIDISFNSDAVRAIFARPLANTSLQWDAGWLHHSDNGDVIHAGLNLVDFASDGVDPLKAGIGGRVVYTNGDHSNQDGFAVPLGGSLRYVFPRYNRIYVSGALYYAPDILSIGDMEKYQDYMFQVGYNIMHDANVYIGARYVKGEYDDARDSRYDTGMNIGINLNF
jgi:hypothetical protein